MNTEENNLSIDLFMAEFEKHESDRLTIINDLTVKGHSPRKYNESWDLLMPVCRKLDNLDTTRINYLDAYELLSDKLDDATTKDYNIEDVYPVVVEFIKWYSND